jgi:hypothetical protein
MNKGEYSYGILDNELRNEWSLNLVGGVDKTYYPTANFFSWGDLQSERRNYLFVSTTDLYNGHHDCYESQYTINFRFNLSFFLGIKANIGLGYK